MHSFEYSSATIPSLLDYCKTSGIEYLCNYPLASHTGFKTGGLAEIYCSPTTQEQIQDLVIQTSTHGIPLTVIGECSNVLIADKGITGLVININRIKDLQIKENSFVAGAGLNVKQLCGHLVRSGIGSLAYLYGMPGTIGGAVWMNARCYGQEIADSLIQVTSVAKDGTLCTNTIQKDPASNLKFDYKLSPFQSGQALEGHVITAAQFTVHRDSQINLWKKMLEHEFDRRKKGHYFAPCAGSVFKNNKAFGEPTGSLLDKLGVRGMKRGQAEVSPFHANIIINRGKASSENIYQLVQDLMELSYARTSCLLEPEIVFLGDWNDVKI